MKRSVLSVLAMLLMVSFLIASPSVIVPAWAGGIAAVHGSSGHIEYQDRVDSTRQFFGWGLDYDQASGMGNWIHYSIPVPIPSTVQYLGIRFKTGSTNAYISDFHVYNGKTKIYDSPGVTLSGETYTDSWYIINMESAKTINVALGLSIEVEAGSGTGSRSIEIYAVGAGWN